ncbi:MAG: hypothetical protein LBR61_03400, partial [Synergistaceae bacterium]|nr:hypothetical protein [Synergistaceae bacterium]
DGSISGTMTLPQPPLLAVEKTTLVFPIQTGQNVGDDKNRCDMNVRGQGGWTAEITSGADWFTIQKTGDILSVKMNGDNTTGRYREGNIRITRSGNASNPINVAITQTPN